MIGQEHENVTGLGRTLCRLVPDVEAGRLLDADAPERDCAGAMARLKAALAALGASRP